MHADERAGNIQQQHRTDQQTALPTHEKHQQHHHNDNRFNQVEHEPIDRFNHHFTLVINGIELHAFGTGRLEFGQL